MRQKIHLTERLERKGPRKLLAIDGGGIRGVLALQILAKIESLLREETKNGDYRLADYFDYVAGTSTGAIIAAGISLGMSVGEILDLYLKNGSDIFDKASIVRHLQYKYESEPLANELKTAFHEATTLGSEEIETLLLVVLRNATTDSPWPLSNNPFAKYNDPAEPANNVKFPLWQVVRASTQRLLIFLQK
jgi:patatin-like phospholipase/acyl hydrolase